MDRKQSKMRSWNTDNKLDKGPILHRSLRHASYRNASADMMAPGSASLLDEDDCQNSPLEAFTAAPIGDPANSKTIIKRDNCSHFSNSEYSALISAIVQTEAEIAEAFDALASS
jgi:hypothetical protein